MNDLPLRRESLLPRIDGMQKSLVLLEKFGKMTIEEFEKDEVLDRVQHNLRLVLEGVFNITSHILARIPGARETEYKRMARKLGEIGIVDKKFAETVLVEIAGYRNRLTHFYAEIKATELHRICQTKLKDIEIFLGAIKNLIANPGKFGLSVE